MTASMPLPVDSQYQFPADHALEKLMVKSAVLDVELNGVSTSIYSTIGHVNNYITLVPFLQDSSAHDGNFYVAFPAGSQEHHSANG